MRQDASRGGGEPAEPQTVDKPGAQACALGRGSGGHAGQGQRVFFAESRAPAGASERRASGCTLEMRSGNATAERDVRGTPMPVLPAGHRHCAHITAPRGEAWHPAGPLAMNQLAPGPGAAPVCATASSDRRRRSTFPIGLRGIELTTKSNLGARLPRCWVQ